MAMQVGVSPVVHQPQVNGPRTPEQNGPRTLEQKMNGSTDEAPHSPGSPASSPLSMDGQLSPNDAVFRSPSPCSTGSRSSGEFRRRGDSCGSSGRSFEYGRFYNTSFLKDDKDPKYIKRASSGNVPGTPKSHNYHRPDGFSYSKSIPQYGKPMKKESSVTSAMGCLVNSISTKKVTRKVIRSKSPQRDKKNEEAIRLAAFPDAKVPKPNEKPKIERDDWPAPPSIAAVLPEVYRSSKAKSKSPAPTSRLVNGSLENDNETTDAKSDAHISKESDRDIDKRELIKMAAYPAAKFPGPYEKKKIERDDWPGPPSIAAIWPELVKERRRSRGDVIDGDVDEDKEEEQPIDPKLVKELQEVTKLSKESPMGKVIQKDLEHKVEEMKHKQLDPRSASRVPAADHEPTYRTRYESSMFASPSRILDLSKPRRSWDDSQTQGQRSKSTSTLPAGITPPRPGYTYGYAASKSRSATLPVGTSPSFSFRDFDSDHSGDEIERYERRSAFTSTSSMNTDNSFKRLSQRASSIADGPPFVNSALLSHSRRSLTTQKDEYLKEPDKPHPYDELVTNPPKGLDKNALEKYLSNEEFERLFKMTRQEFYRKPEWKRNDMKVKLQLL